MDRSYAFEASAFKASAFEASVAIIIIVLLSVLAIMMLSAPRTITGGWELPGNGSVDYMFVGSNDTLYAFRGNDIAAVRGDGSIAWTYTVPGTWSVLNNWSLGSRPIETRPAFAEAAGHLYLVAIQRLTADDRARIDSHAVPYGFSRVAAIIALSPEGEEEWQYPFSFVVPPGQARSLLYDETTMPYTIALAIRGGRTYLFKDFAEHIIDPGLDGVTVVTDVASPPAIDEEGRAYLVRAVWYGNVNGTVPMPTDAEITQSLRDDYGGMLPTGTVEAYGPGGALLWSRAIGRGAVRQELWDSAGDKYNSLPLYVNGTLYVPVKDGLVALDRDGNVKWECRLPGDDRYYLFELMPADGQGNVYMRNRGIRLPDPNGTMAGFFPVPQPEKLPEYLYVISPQGEVSRRPWTYGPYGSVNGEYISLVPMAADDGTVYMVNSTGAIDRETFEWMLREDRLNPDRLLAIDARSGALLWNFTVPAADMRFVRLNADNLDDALPGYTRESVDQLMAKELRQGWRPDLGLFFYGDDVWIDVHPGGNVTYLNYCCAVFESPIVYGRSKCIYARSLYAIDDTGNMLWKKPVDGLVTAMAANNSTFYYGTDDGRIGTVTGNMVAAGIALAAAVYMFVRFFLLGTIARARGRIGKNVNRNAILQHIADHPGVTAVDVARALGVNLGTARYHLFILASNHRILSHKEDGKFLRYFANSGAYSERERSLLSLLRREPLRRVLEKLAEKPGLSNLELAKELNVSAAAVHDNINELYARGILAKDMQGDKSYTYSIKEELRPLILEGFGRL